MISDNLHRILNSLPASVKLIAVTKKRSLREIEELYRNGYNVFGENRVQDLVERYSTLPKDIEWHLIGHLQTNKVKNIAPFVSLIHSVDSLKLLQIINKEAQKCNRIIPCLLQFYIADEETKFGLSVEEAEKLLSSETFSEMKNIQIVGVMGMASNTDNQTQIKEEFVALASIFNSLKSNHFQDKSFFKEISMGMSSDYLLAVEQGSTMVRVGSALFE